MEVGLIDDFDWWYWQVEFSISSADRIAIGSHLHQLIAQKIDFRSARVYYIGWISHTEMAKYNFLIISFDDQVKGLRYMYLRPCHRSHQMVLRLPLLRSSKSSLLYANSEFTIISQAVLPTIQYHWNVCPLLGVTGRFRATPNSRIMIFRWQSSFGITRKAGTDIFVFPVWCSARTLVTASLKLMRS